MIALRQVMSYDWGKPQVMSDCVALGERGQSYHNVPKAPITFAKQNHNSKLFTSLKNTKPRASDLSSTICFNQKGRFDYMLSRLFFGANLAQHYT